MVEVERSVGLGPRMLRRHGIAQGILRQEEVRSVSGDPEAAERFETRWGCIRNQRMRVQRFTQGAWRGIRRPFTNRRGFYRAPREITRPDGSPRPGSYRTVAPPDVFTGPDGAEVRCLRAVSPVRRVPRG